MTFWQVADNAVFGILWALYAGYNLAGLIRTARQDCERNWWSTRIAYHWIAFIAGTVVSIGLLLTNLRYVEKIVK